MYIKISSKPKEFFERKNTELKKNRNRYSVFHPLMSVS